jgi:hypothetical protein
LDLFFLAGYSSISNAATHHTLATPSSPSLTTERLIGDAAMNQVAMNPHDMYVYLSLFFFT